MTEPSARKGYHSIGNDGDGTDAEINRKLTERLRAGAVKASTDADIAQPAVYEGARSVPRALGLAIAQTFGLGALVVLMILAGIHAHFYEKG